MPPRRSARLAAKPQPKYSESLDSEEEVPVAKPKAAKPTHKVRVECDPLTGRLFIVNIPLHNPTYTGT